MYIRFAIYIVSLALNLLFILCHASSDSFENSDDRVRKRKITDFDLSFKDHLSKKPKSGDKQDDFNSSLPAEILVNILSELLLYDIIHCGQVNKTWYDAYRLLLTSSHVPLFCQYFLGDHKYFRKDKKICMSEQEFAVNHLLLDDNVLFEIQNHKIHNTSYTIYNSPHLNNISEKIVDIILVKKESPFYIEGVEQHYQLIQQWYRKILAKFDVIASMNIGYMYEYGKGVQQDLGTACEWYEKARYGSKKSDKTYLPSIYYRLGRTYELWSRKRHVEFSNNDGPNANDDIVNARHNYQKAADQNYTSAKHRLDLLKICEQDNQLFQESYDIDQLGFE